MAGSTSIPIIVREARNTLSPLDSIKTARLALNRFRDPLSTTQGSSLACHRSGPPIPQCRGSQIAPDRSRGRVWRGRIPVLAQPWWHGIAADNMSVDTLPSAACVPFNRHGPRLTLSIRGARAHGSERSAVNINGVICGAEHRGRRETKKHVDGSTQRGK